MRIVYEYSYEKFVDVSPARQSSNEFGSVLAYSKHSSIQVFN